MVLRRFVTMFIGLVGFSSFLSAAEITGSVKVDHGSLKIVWDTSVDSMEVDHSLLECPSSFLKFTKQSSAHLEIEHQGKECHNGAEITVKINPKAFKVVNVDFGAGVMNLEEVSDSASIISGDVKCGVIQSSRFTPKTAYYNAGATIYGANSKSAFPELSVSLSAGVLKL